MALPENEGYMAQVASLCSSYLYHILLETVYLIVQELVTDLF